MLSKEQIIAALPPATREVPVPEMGEGATLQIAAIGPQAYGRLQDLYTHLLQPKPRLEPDDTDDGVLYTCDTPPEERPEERPDDGQIDTTDGEADELTMTWAAQNRLCVEWAAASIVGGDNQPLFTPDEIEQVFRGHEGRRVLIRIMEAAQDLNLLTEESRDEEAKNSERTAGDAGGGE